MLSGVLQPWLVATAICAVFVALESVMAGRGVEAFMKALRQPRWAPPLPVWIAIGVVYYLLCVVVMTRLLAHRIVPSASLALLLTVMTANAVWNFLLFRQRAFGRAAAYLVAYAGLVITLVVTLWRADRLSAELFAGYALYLLYALPWNIVVWRMNRVAPAIEGEIS